MRDIIARHEVIALQFSGGKDSLACLYLLEEFWQKLHVVWGNTGDAFPETLALIAEVRALVPHFIEVKSDVRAQQEKYGYPCDVLPVRNHPTVAMIIHPHERPKLQSCFACCRDNLWEPMQQQMERMRATLIIRGQRTYEVQHSPVRSGDVINGVEYLFPIEDWSSERVREYLGARLPEHYSYMDTGLDCQHCTAHLFENIGKRRFTRERHPELHAELTRRLEVIAGEVEHEHAILREAIAA